MKWTVVRFHPGGKSTIARIVKRYTYIIRYDPTRRAWTLWRDDRSRNRVDQLETGILTMDQARSLAEGIINLHPNPGKRHFHTAKWRRMVRAIKRRGGAYSPYAVATARLRASRYPPMSKSGIKRWTRQYMKEHPVKNPFSSKTKRRAARIASRLAYRIWDSVNKRGFALPIPKRTPKLVKKYAQKILSANNINVRLK